MRLAICALACAGSLAAQSLTTAIVSGHVEDSSGAAIQKAVVSALLIDKSQTWTALADSAGRFRLAALPPGHYRLSVSAARLQTSSRQLTLSVGQDVQLPFTLNPASASTTVDVTENSEALETVRTQVSETVSRREVDSLPLNGRNYLDLALLTPLVSRTNTGSNEKFAETSAVPGTGISVAGQRNLQVGFVVDGLSANDDAADLAGTFFSQEVVREFQVITSGGIAEFGRASSGTLNIVTRSGTDELHGRAYGFARNQRFDARNPLASGKDPLTQAQYGASLGGPIEKGRTFFFSNFEQTRQHRAGIITISQNSVDAVNAVLQGVGYRGGRLTTGEYPTGYETTNFFGRVDHRISDSQNLAARYSFYDVSSWNARNVGGLGAVSRGTALNDRDHTVALNHTWSQAARVNEARFEWTRSGLSAPPNDQAGPAISISGVANIGVATSSPTGRDLDLYEGADSYSFVHGAHSIKLGGDFLWNRVNILFPGALPGVYSFSSLANFRSGTYVNFQQAFGIPAQFQSNPNAGLFAQDEWRVARHLTLKAGIRFDVEKLASPVQVDWGDVAPRLGLAYSPDAKTVVRASAGIFYDRMPLRATSNALQRDGSKYRVAVINFGQPGAPLFPSLISSFPAGILPSATVIDPRIRNSYAVQSGLQIEREAGKGTTVSVGYEHLRGIHIIMSRNINVPTLTAAQAAQLGIPNLGRPNPGFGNISQYEGTGDSYFNGLTVSVNHRAGKYATGRLSYTFSKAIDDAGNAFFNSPQNAFDLRDDRGLSPNDQRHRLTVSGVLDSPWRKTAARDWQVSGIFSYASPAPFNIQTGTDRLNQGNTNARPFGVGRNTGTGFNYATLDLRVNRQFRLSERWKLETLVEGFNILNRANYQYPNGNFGSGQTPAAGFGRPTAAGDARQVQLGLKLDW